MPYATADDMRAEYGEEILVQLSDAPAWDSVAIARVNQKLASAATLIDGFVAKYYAAAPGVTVPPLLVAINCTMAYADLHRVLTEDAKDRRAEAIRQLEQISRGMIKLDDGRGDLPARGGAVIVPDRERTFSRDGLRGF
jgi:phage gp36-like protein